MGKLVIGSLIALAAFFGFSKSAAAGTSANRAAYDNMSVDQLFLAAMDPNMKDLQALNQMAGSFDARAAAGGTDADRAKKYAAAVRLKFAAVQAGRVFDPSTAVVSGPRVYTYV